MTQGFDDAVNGHKSNLTKSMKDFGEDRRIHHLLRDIDLNICDYEYYFNQGEKSRQAEIEELQKRIDDLEKNKLCIQNLVKKLNIAESKLNKIAIQAQKKLETFGSALRFKDAVQDILKGNKDEK